MNLPADLTELDQWVCWRYEDRGGKRTKVPTQPTGKPASATDRRTWRPYAEVASLEGFAGIGFVFDAQDPYVGIDLDNCLDSSGAIKPWAVPYIAQFHDTYAEISPSGTGIKIFTRGKLPGRGRRRHFHGPDADYAIEIYDQGRFFTVTGNVFAGAPLQTEEHQAEILALYASLEEPKNGTAPKAGEPIRQGNRHRTLVSMAGAMRRRGMSPDAIDAALWAENQARCQPPYDRKHIRQIADSADKWVPDPRSSAVPDPAGQANPQSVVDLANLPETIEECYSPQFVESVALLHLNSQFDIKKALRAKFGKEFHSREFDRRVNSAVRPAPVDPSPTRLICSDNGNPKAVLANAIIQLKDSGIDLAYDTFASRVIIKNPSPWGTNGPWSDRDDTEAANYLQHQNILVGSLVAHEAAAFLAYQHPFHPVLDQLAMLKWDGIPRLDTWMIRFLGAEDSPYMRAVAAKWMISAVARIRKPGCKADYVIVLEGKQGKRKSMALRALANGHTDGQGGNQFFSDDMPDIDSDEVNLFLQGVWIIEIAELEAIRGKEWTRTKKFISKQAERFRMKYGRNIQSFPRQCIFAASTNEERWAGDPTGNRRYWPVHTSSINVDGILKEQQQLWAEACFRYDEGETWWLDDRTEELAVIEQSARAPDDSWVETLAQKIANSSEFAMYGDISVGEALDMLGERHETAKEMRAGSTLVKLGFVRYRSTREGRPWRYRKPDPE